MELTMLKKIIFSVIFILYAILLQARLSTTFTEVLINNLQPGKTYSLEKLFKKPYSITSKSPIPIDIKIKIIPTEIRYMRKGYQAPSLSWLRLSRTNFPHVQPGETIYNDIIISLPDDDTYMDKKYQISILAESYSEQTIIDFAIESFLLFSIAPVRSKLDQKEINNLDLSLNFNVTPKNIYMTNFKVSAMAKNSIGLFEINNNDDIDHNYNILNLSQQDWDHIQKGYIACPDISALTFSHSNVCIPAHKSQKIDVYLSLHDPEYKNKKYQFIICTTKIEAGVIQGKVFTRIFVTTQ